MQTYFAFKTLHVLNAAAILFYLFVFYYSPHVKRWQLGVYWGLVLLQLVLGFAIVSAHQYSLTATWLWFSLILFVCFIFISVFYAYQLLGAADKSWKLQHTVLMLIGLYVLLLVLMATRVA